MATALNGAACESRGHRVTGGSRGVGQAAACRLASGGCIVVVNYLHDQRAAELTVEAILAGNCEAMAVRADVADDLDVKRLFAETIAAFGGVDVPRPHRRQSPHRDPRFLRQASTSSTHWSGSTPRATFVVDREAACHLRNGGAIVNLSSSAEGSSLRTYGLYAATKAITNVLAQTLALELRERDITVNAVSPAIHGPCIPNRVTDIIAYLLSDHGHRLTGQILRVAAAELRP